jgi:acyl-CoA synthetase (AMP-forming)/AMP-acid ligase II
MIKRETRVNFEPRFARIGDMVRAQADIYGNKIALRSGGRSLSYRDLDIHSNRVANGLITEGVQPGQRVVWLGKNSERYFEVFCGAAKANAVICPVNWRLAAPELAWIIADSSARTAFVSEEFAERIAKMPGLALERIHVVKDDDPAEYIRWRDGFDSEAPDISVSPDDDGLQIYSSGTTGRPKGVHLSHRALLVFRSLRADVQPEWNRWVDDDVAMLVTPQFHISGTGYGLQTLCAGATGIILREFDANDVLDLIEHSALSKVFVVPAILEMLLRHPRVREVNYDRIRSLVYSASPIPLPLLREAMDVFGCGFVQQYGMTEACGTVTVLGPEDHDPAGNSRMLSAGRPLHGVDLDIVDANGDRLPVGMSGEIVIRSPTLMSGYWRNPEATAAAIDGNGFYRTGDVGYLDSEGYVYIVDRLKDMIVSGGENIYPAEVEMALKAHPMIEEVAVIGVPDKKWGEAVKAFIVPSERDTLSADEILIWGRHNLAGYKLPKSIDFVDEIPKNANGKISRETLRAPYWVGFERLVN